MAGYVFPSRGPGDTTLLNHEKRLHAIEQPPGPVWTLIGAAGAPPFLNAWVNFSGTAPPAAFTSDGHFTHIQGLIKSGVIGNAAFQLPVGYWPISQTGVVGDAYEFAINGGAGAMVLGIDVVGNVVVRTGTNASAWINCSFLHN